MESGYSEYLLRTVPGIEDISQRELRSVAQQNCLNLESTSPGMSGARLHFYCTFFEREEDVLSTMFGLRTVRQIHRVRHRFELSETGKIVMLVLERGPFNHVLHDLETYTVIHERRVTTGAIRPTVLLLERT